MTQSTTDTEKDPYRELQEHLDQLPTPFPATYSGVEISLLKRVFTPEEARIASRLKFAMHDHEDIDSIHERLKDLGYSKEQLEEKLDSMLRKGGIMANYDENGQKSYSCAMLIFGIFEFQINKLTEGFVRDLYAYM